MLARVINATVVLFLVFAHGTTAQEPPAGGPRLAGPPRTDLAAVPKAAMVHHFRSTGDPGLLVEQMYAADLLADGLAPDTIIERVLAKRREWNRMRNVVSTGEWTANEYGKTIVRGLARYASHRLGAGGTGVEFANLGIQAYEDILSNVEVSRAAQRFADGYAEVDAAANEESDVIDHTIAQYYAHPEYASVFDTLFAPIYGFKPTDSDDVVLQQYPQFAQHEAIRSVLQGTRDNSDALGALGDTLRTRNAAILERVGNLQGALRGRWEREENARRQARLDAIDLAGYRSAADLAATFIGFSDPTLGRQVQVTSNAMFSVHEGLKAFDAARELAGANMNLATIALAGNFVGAGLSLANAFMDTGPTGDEIILGELAKLSEQVYTVREEMHERFDGVHERLDAIYTNMTNGFETLAGLVENVGMDLRDLVRDVHDGLADVRSELRTVASVQLDFVNLVIAQNELLRDLITDLALERCRRSYEEPIPVDAFVTCVQNIDAVAGRLPDEQLGPYRADETVNELLRSYPSYMVNASYQKFRTVLQTIGGRVNGLPSSVVGPEQWLYFAELHDRFLSDHPYHDPRLAGRGDFEPSMRLYRQNLARYIDALQGELAAFRDGSRETAVAALLRELWQSHANLEDLLAAIIEQYYEDDGHYRWRTIRGGDGSLVPELTLGAGTDMADAWAPISAFYTGIPEWVKVPGAACPDAWGADDAAVRAVRQALGVDGIVRYVGTGYIALARLGMGHVDVCGTVENARRGLQIVLEISYGGGVEACGSATRLFRGQVTRDAGGRDERVFASVLREIAGMARVARGGVDLPGLSGSATEVCLAAYHERLREERYRLSEFVRRELEQRDEFRIVAARMMVLGAHFRSWVRLGLHDAVARSEMVGAIAQGTAGAPGAPDLFRMLDRGGSLAQALGEDAKGEIVRLESALRSTAMGDALRYGAGYRILTETRFRNGIDRN